MYLPGFKHFVLLFLCLYGSIVLAQDNSKIISGYVLNEILVALPNALIFNEQFSLDTTSDSLFIFNHIKNSAYVYLLMVDYTGHSLFNTIKTKTGINNYCSIKTKGWFTPYSNISHA